MHRTLFLALLLAPAAAPASSLLFEQDDRALVVQLRRCDHESCDLVDAESAHAPPGFGPWNESTTWHGVTVSMISTLTPETITLDARASTPHAYCNAFCDQLIGAADLAITFRVSASTAFVFSGSAAAFDDHPQINELVGGLEIVRFRAAAAGDFEISGTLEPDRLYRLHAGTRVGIAGAPPETATWASFVIAPEPSAALLLALGLAATGTARRLPRASRRPTS